MDVRGGIQDITSEDFSKLQAVLLLIVLLLVGLRLTDDYFIAREAAGDPKGQRSAGRSRFHGKSKHKKSLRARTFSSFIDGLSLGAGMSPPIFTPRLGSDSESQPISQSASMELSNDSHDVCSPRKKRRHQL
ncbi:MAG: hypothetical protein VXZ58_04365 [Actinomycetota bacterium]|nr:hypothetical protein [Actinomycetota bacterium]